MAKRTDAELVEFSHRLLHDVQVFFHVGRTLTRSRLGWSRSMTWEVEMALVESFALHTRGLTDFFFTFELRRYKTDAFAMDYFDPESGWERIAPQQGVWLREMKFHDPRGAKYRTDRFGEQLAHLTYHAPAVSDYARGWPVMQVMSEIGAVLWGFSEHVQDAKVAGDFKSKARREIPAASRLDDKLKPMAVWSRPVTTRPLAH